MMIRQLSWRRNRTGDSIQKGRGGEGEGASTVAADVARYPTKEEPSTATPPLRTPYYAPEQEEETLGSVGYGIPVSPNQQPRLSSRSLRCSEQLPTLSSFSSHQGSRQWLAAQEQKQQAARKTEPQVVRHEIEVLPGFTLTLRGADETYAAHQRNQCTTLTCVGCYKTVSCIQDADYVLCPACHVMTPLVVAPCPGASSRVGGLGLGFLVSGSGSNWCQNPTWP